MEGHRQPGRTATSMNILSGSHYNCLFGETWKPFFRSYYPWTLSVSACLFAVGLLIAVSPALSPASRQPNSKGRLRARCG